VQMRGPNPPRHGTAAAKVVSPKIRRFVTRNSPAKHRYFLSTLVRNTRGFTVGWTMGK